jgi:hypothetical protein
MLCPVYRTDTPTYLVFNFSYVPQQNFHSKSNFADDVLRSLSELSDLTVLRYDQTSEGDDRFYLLEQSSLLVLREFPSDTPMEVTEVFSERHRISQKSEIIKASRTVQGFLNIVIPLVENGSFPCKDLTIIVNHRIELTSHDDGEVCLVFEKGTHLFDLMNKILTRQKYNPSLLLEIINRPNLYHKIERPDKISSSFKTFEELLETF